MFNLLNIIKYIIFHILYLRHIKYYAVLFFLRSFCDGVFLDPSTWAGLLTLVILEVVLGIDNLIFVAILSEKLPPNQRDKARLIGLGLALVMRLALLSLISWVVTLTSPIIHNSFLYQYVM